MSEYQYCEFQTLDRPLTEDEQAEISKLSSRVALTSTQAMFTYQFGDFPARAEEILERYFDALLYLANWGTRRLMFRFPKSLIDIAQVQPYAVEVIIEFRETDEHVILDIDFNEEDASFWVEGEGSLSSLVLRSERVCSNSSVRRKRWPLGSEQSSSYSQMRSENARRQRENEHGKLNASDWQN